MASVPAETIAAPRERMDYDVVIVGGGPAGLAAAIRLKQMALAAGRDIGVCLIDKGAQIGAHILSGALLDPAALLALIPDAAAQGAPLGTPVNAETLLLLTARHAIPVPGRLLPKALHNRGCYIASLSALCQWLAERAEALGVEIYPGFAAVDLVYGEDGAVRGVRTGDFGLGRDGARKPTYAPGMELCGKYVLLGEGARGTLGEKAIARYDLRAHCDPQTYGLGLKEVWRVPADRHVRGLAVHTMGWPLGNAVGGGLFVYHWGGDRVSVGMVVHLDYANPNLSPFEEFQRAKRHPAIRRHLEGGTRIGFGARTIAEGGWQAIPRLVFPGGALIGDTAGFVNVPRIKGIHNAIASGMLAGEAAFAALIQGRGSDTLSEYEAALRTGTIAADLKPVRNVKPLWSRFGLFPGLALGGIDLWCQTLFGAGPFGTLHRTRPDWAGLRPLAAADPIAYPKPDGVLSFDRASSVHLSNTAHAPDQPVHLRLTDPDIPLTDTLPRFGEPAQRYCPAGVYGIDRSDAGLRFRIDAENCLHCKACEIKDPAQNIAWVPPEGGGGPNYVEM